MRFSTKLIILANNLNGQNIGKLLHPNYDEFIESCKKGDLEAVEKAIQLLCTDVFTLELFADEALCKAAQYGHLPVVNCLLEIAAVSVKPTTCLRALCLAVKDDHLNVATRLLKEKGVVDHMRQHQQYLQSVYPAFFQKVKNMGKSRVLAAKVLSNCNQRLPADIVNKILTFAFHDVMCGKRECHKPPKDSTGNAVSTCSTINQFRDAVINSKKPEGNEEATPQTKAHKLRA